MRRSILSAAARPSRSLTGLNYPRRTFTSTIAAQEQVHPIGPFYEAILRSPPFIPETKPEAAPVSSAPEVVEKLPERPKPTPTAPAPATPAAEQQPAKVEKKEPPKKEETPAVETPSKPAAAPKTKTKASAAAPKEAQEDTPAPVKETPAKRTRASSKKAKSVAPESPSSATASLSARPSSSSSSDPSLSSVILPSPSSSSSTTSREPPNPPLDPQSNAPPQQDRRDPISTDSRESNSQSSSSSKPAAAEDTPESRARVIFASSLVGPAERAERLAAIKARSRLVAGVLVPPKPEEPDNCCMSGCVNCVWERYRDELEEWASASAEADRRLMARDASSSDIDEEGLLEEERGGRETSAIESVDASMAAADRNGGGGRPTREEIPAVGSMDDDGGGSETNWTATPAGKKLKEKEFWNEELYKNVPVGIREFMKQEKRLKEKHLREGTLGG